MEEKTIVFGNLEITTDGYKTTIRDQAWSDFAVVIDGMEYDVNLVNLQDNIGARLVYENCPVETQTWRQLE